MPPKDTTPSEADIVFNRANVALARSQRLIQSWLPPKTAEDVVHEQHSTQDLLKEDEQVFKATPELLGLGATAPDADQDALLRKRPGANNDRLLEQLLGKKAARGHRASSKPHPVQRTAAVDAGDGDDDDEEEEEGRATMVASSLALKRKKPKAVATRKATSTTFKVDTVEPCSDEDEDSRPSSKRAASYLDQLLAEKASKKKRKQKA